MASIQDDTDVTNPSDPAMLSERARPGQGQGRAQPSTYGVYSKRWLILLLFCSYSASNAFQWNEYVIIDDIVKDYYGVSTLAVEWTTMCYMAVYIPLIFPGTYLIENKGLRKVAIAGAALNAIGAWIKVGSASPDRFWLTMCGQVVCGVGQVFILGLPARLAALWFGANEVATATAVGVFGNQVGIALGFLVPPLVMNACNGDTSKGLIILFASITAITNIQLILVWFVFQDRPPMPPSPSQAALSDLARPGRMIDGHHCEDQSQEPSVTSIYIKSIKSLVSDASFMLLLLAYGLNVGVFYCISTLLNRIIIYYFEEAEHISGVTGLILVISGLFGSVLAGVVLDKTKAYKDVTIFVYTMSVVCMLLFTFLIRYRSSALIYVISGLLGFFMTGYLPIGFEFASEITWPEPEGTSSGLINMCAQVCGITLILVGGRLTDIYTSPVWANLFMVACLTAGLYLTYFMKSNLKRQKATQEHQDNEQRALIPNN